MKFNSHNDKLTTILKVGEKFKPFEINDTVKILGDFIYNDGCWYQISPNAYNARQFQEEDNLIFGQTVIFNGEHWYKELGAEASGFVPGAGAGIQARPLLPNFEDFIIQHPNLWERI